MKPCGPLRITFTPSRAASASAKLAAMNPRAERPEKMRGAAATDPTAASTPGTAHQLIRVCG